MTKTRFTAAVVAYLAFTALIAGNVYQQAYISVIEQRRPTVITVTRIVEKRVFARLEDLPKISANMLPELPANGRLK